MIYFVTFEFFVISFVISMILSNFCDFFVISVVSCDFCDFSVISVICLIFFISVISL